MPGPRRELKVEQSVQARILAHMRRSYSEIDRELRRLENRVGPGAKLQRAQLRASREAMRGEIADLWKLVGSEVEAGRIMAARAAGDNLAEAADVFLRAGLSTKDITDLKRGMREAASRNVEAAVRRVHGDSYVPLSTRVWKSRVLVTGQLDRVIFDQLSRGASARDFAKAVRQFVDPGTRGGARYAAARLARTEINNAHHAVMKREIEAEPFVDYAKWHLSGSHKIPDECNEYAEEDHAGEGPGVYKKANVPRRPHPNCFCYVTAITVGRDEFIAAYARGDYDTWLQSHGVETPERPAITSTAASASASASAQPAWLSKTSAEFRQDLVETQTMFLDQYDAFDADLRTKPGFTALEGYRSNAQRFNQARRTPEKADARDLADADALKTFIQNHGTKASKDFFVSRGVHRWDGMDLTEGGYLVEPGFMSTTANRSLAKGFADDGVILDIHVPAGTTYVPGIKHEMEFILPPNTKLRLLKVADEEDKYGDVLTHVWAEVVPGE